MRVGIVPERHNARMSLERGLCDASLNTATTAMYDSDADESGSSRLCDVFLHNRRHVRRLEAVEIQFRTNRQHHRPIVVDRIGQDSPNRVGRAKYPRPSNRRWL